MNECRTAAIGVTIGRQSKAYHPFITTAPARLDAPSTLTLYSGPLSDLVLMAAEPYVFDATRARTPTRLILVDSIELGYQKARSRREGHRLTAADPILIGFTTLQRWLWQRLLTSGEGSVGKSLPKMEADGRR